MLTEALEGARSVGAVKRCRVTVHGSSEGTERREDGKTEDRNQNSEFRIPNPKPQTRPMLTEAPEGVRPVGPAKGC